MLKLFDVGGTVGIAILAVLFLGLLQGQQGCNKPEPPPVPSNWIPNDGKCETEKGESINNSPEDCKDVTPEWIPNDGICDAEHGENPDNSPADCKPPEPPQTQTQPVCGDGVCTEPENSTTCPSDCPVIEPPPIEPPPVEPKPVCGDGKCDPGETPQNCLRDCPKPPEPPQEADKVLDKTRLIMYGQYVQFNQPRIDWKAFGKWLYETGYNAVSIHGLSPWGGYKEMQPWVYVDGTYNMDKKNDAYFDNVTRFVDAMAHYDITIEWCFYDRYFEAKWKALIPAPFCKNNKGINWCDNAKPLYESWNKTGGSAPPDSAFAWVKWTTNGKDGFAERVIGKKYVHGIGPVLEKYQDDLINIFVKAKIDHPGMDKMLIRFSNENDVIYRTDGTHVVFGGESKLYEIIQMEFQEAGWKNGNQFQIVDDGTPLDVVIYGGQSELFINLKQLAKQQKYLKMMNWLQELHNMDAGKVKDILSYGAGTTMQMDANGIIFSTDGMKPENDSFVPKCQLLFNMKWDGKPIPKLDFKVPSDLTPFRNMDFNYSFQQVQPVMKKIVIK